eukprot:11059399-Alexandrium_andersonii.AAC.1
MVSATFFSRAPLSRKRSHTSSAARTTGNFLVSRRSRPLQPSTASARSLSISTVHAAVSACLAPCL